MHPFALNDKQVEDVSGGFLMTHIGTIRLPFPLEVSSMMYGEEGGQPPIILPSELQPK